MLSFRFFRVDKSELKKDKMTVLVVVGIDLP